MALILVRNQISPNTKPTLIWRSSMVNIDHATISITLPERVLAGMYGFHSTRLTINCLQDHGHHARTTAMDSRENDR